MFHTNSKSKFPEHTRNYMCMYVCVPHNLGIWAICRLHCAIWDFSEWVCLAFCKLHNSCYMMCRLCSRCSAVFRSCNSCYAIYRLCNSGCVLCWCRATCCDIYRSGIAQQWLCTHNRLCYLQIARQWLCDLQIMQLDCRLCIKCYKHTPGWNEKPLIGLFCYWKTRPVSWRSQCWSAW